MQKLKSANRANIFIYITFGLGIVILIAVLLLLRFSFVTDHMYSALVKDPERVIPQGRVIVAPADGIVVYVKRVDNGVVPEIVKRGVSIPVEDDLKTTLERPMEEGVLIGIYMNTFGVHINRIPLEGELIRKTIFSGPHMEMTKAETKIIVTQLVPGWIAFKKLLGLPPYAIENDADFMLKSARETLTFKDVRDHYIYVTRIADYYVGKILTWVNETEHVETGQKLGMITWGSQTDVLIESSPGLEITIKPGDMVFGGESVIAIY